jgi:RNA polymerase sigma factor (sigma-70 family)
MDNTDLLDQADMARLVAGKESPLEDLIQRHGQKLLAFLTRLAQNETDAEDLMYETFVKVYQNRARFDPKHRFTTWLYTIATNLTKDRFKWRSRHPEVPIESDSEHEGGLLNVLPDGAKVPSENLESRERAEAVRCAVQALPEELRTPLILAEYEALPQAEIAKILNCTVKAVETRIYRARQQLRKQLFGLATA